MKEIVRTNKNYSFPSKENIHIAKTQCTLLMRL